MALLTKNETKKKQKGTVRTRPTYDEYFTAMAELVSTRSTCLRRQFGSVVVQNSHAISTGYNGAPKGMKHCIEIGCLRDELNIPSGTKHEICRGVHAEQNAIIQCAIYGESTKGATLYVVVPPSCERNKRPFMAILSRKSPTFSGGCPIRSAMVSAVSG